ncbi:hypothetical protein JHK87_019083 [Glycine soja]|nr:hypothetical protein JHK87_019083 [Glycine soja]
MGYVYQDVDIPWLQKRTKPKRTRKAKQVAFTQQFGGIREAMAAETGPSSKFPLTLLDSKAKAVEEQKDKEEQEEVLVIDGIEFDGDNDVKFDVYITDEDVEEIGPENTEFAGSFATLGHSHSNMNMDKKIKTSLTLGITDLLEDLDAENDDSILVTLVPRSENVTITIQSIKIEFEKEEFLPPGTPVRVRSAAQFFNKDYLEKYEKALTRMKALPPDDPRSFIQQANIHCAYCDGGYKQVEFPKLDFKVHNSWLFFPFHLFLGKPFHPGEEPNNSAGSVESVPHTPVHIWTGDRNQPNGEDMGRFYSAGRDPIFYSHHANVDRMLNISKTIKGGKRRDSLTLIG